MPKADARDPPATRLCEAAAEARACTLCAAHLPLGPRPVFRVHEDSRVLIVGQAPGTKVHASGLPWDDASGARLRQWMSVDAAAFYDVRRHAIVPMGLCYPGRSRGGDAPPRPECAPLWHPRLLPLMPQRRLTLLVGRYAQRYYLGTEARKQTLEATVRDYARHLARGFFPLPHPSPRNTLWLRRRPWFEADVIPALRQALAAIA